jgi:hypothetical protein
MKIEHAATISAPAAHVWTVFSDVERWPEWTPSVSSVSMIEGAGALAPGVAVRIKQPRMPELTWTVSDIEPGRSWTWVSKSPGVRTTATHEIERIDDRTCRVRQVIEHRGPLAGVVGWLTRARTRRYLEQEAAGLKRRAEASWTVDAAAT